MVMCACDGDCIDCLRDQVHRLEAEVERMRPVVKAALDWDAERGPWTLSRALTTSTLVRVLDTYRRATEEQTDAE